MFLLAFIPRVKALGVEAKPLRAGEILDEILRQAICVVQLERLVAGHDFRPLRRPLEHLLQPRQAAGQHRAEALLLAPDHLDDGVASRLQLRIGAAHLAHQHVDQRVEERLVQPQLAAVAHRAAHDLAQHVAAPFVRGDHTVGDQERRRAHVIGDHPHRDVGRHHRRGVAVPRQRAGGRRGSA